MKRFAHYRFRSVWRIDASPDRVFEALHDLASYPKWWPEVKRASEISDGFFELEVRSRLPYSLRFTSRRKRDDRAAGVLVADLRGDLEGYTSWTIVGAAGATEAIFDEEVDTNRTSLNVLAPMARPAFRYNHEVMMRHGSEGLNSYVDVPATR